MKNLELALLFTILTVVMINSYLAIGPDRPEVKPCWSNLTDVYFENVFQEMKAKEFKETGKNTGQFLKETHKDCARVSAADPYPDYVHK